MFLQGHIHCRTEGLAQHEVHRIRLAIPKFLFAAWAWTLLGHDEINELIWFNQVKSDKGGETMAQAPKVRCQRSSAMWIMEYAGIHQVNLRDRV